MGYEHIDVQVPGGMEGRCKFPNGKSAESWSFLLGETYQEFSYCNKKGYTLKTVEDGEKCPLFLTDKCAVCVLDDGSETEVTELMGLSFYETACGDGVCGVPEDFNSCPEDCPSGAPDTFCDGVRDNICDTDCNANEDPDCTGGQATKFKEGKSELFPSESSSDAADEKTTDEPQQNNRILSAIPNDFVVSVSALLLLILVLFMVKRRKKK